MRSTAMVAALILAGVSCGVQTDQRMDVAPEAEAGRGDGEPVSDAEEALLVTIRCKKSEYGMKCADRCGNAGMFCADLRLHPYKRDVGVGAASRCDGNGEGTSCWYYYVGNGDTCVFHPKKPPLCRYDGG
jgi:hypothetical protein